MSLEVPCPGCGTKLKAPENMLGKKARCKKCNTKFRLTGPAAGGDSVGESQLLSAVELPAPRLPDENSGDVPMAGAVEEAVPEVAPPPLPTARPAFGSGGKIPVVPPAATKAPAKAPAKSQPKPKTVSPPPPPPPVPTEPELLSLDEVDEPDKGPLTANDTSTPTVTEAAAVAGDLFAFNLGDPAPKDEPKSKRRRDDDEDDDRPRSKRRDRDDEEEEPRSRRKDREEEDQRDRKKKSDDPTEEPERPRYTRPGEKPASKKTLVLAGVLGLFAVGAVVAVVIVNKKRDPEPEVKKDDKKQDPPVTPPVTPPDPKGGTGDPPKKDPKDPPKKDPSDPPKKDPKLPPDPPVVRLELPKTLRPFQLRPLAAKPEVVERPSAMPVAMDVPFEKIQRVFAPENRNANDAIAVWVSNAGFNGKGERLTVDSYSGQVGNRVGRFEYDGDGAGAKCDVSTDGKLFVAVEPDSKVSVWDLAKKAKTLDGYDPYADKPDHKKAGLAAVFFAKTPLHILTVSTAGVVHLHDILGKKTLATFTPSGTLIPNRVALGKSVAADDSRSSLVLAVGGVVYQVNTAPPLDVVWKHDLEGEVGRSLGIAVAGNPGRVTYVFETDDGKGKKDRAVMFCLPKGTPEFHRWQDGAGEPRAVEWAGTDLAVISTARGAAWAEYDTESKRFVILALAEVPGGKGIHTTTERAHWYLIPNPTDATKTLFLELATPPSGLIDYRNTAEAKQPLFTVKLDDKGLSR
jgi:hypothetical protein